MRVTVACRKVAVQIDLRKHRELWEDIADVLVSRSRRQWWSRVGDYRVVYEINDRARKVDSTRIAHRRGVYD